MKRFGSNKDRMGSKNPNSRLTEEQVREIRRRHGQGELIAYLGKAYMCNPSTISDIVRGKSWKYVSGEVGV